MTAPSEGVTQADRDAAAAYWQDSLAPEEFAEELRQGVYDHDPDSLPRAFARHRQAATAPLLDVIEAAEKLLRRYRYETPPGHSPHMICHEADELLSTLTAALAQHGRGG